MCVCVCSNSKQAAPRLKEASWNACTCSVLLNRSTSQPSSSLITGNWTCTLLNPSQLNPPAFNFALRPISYCCPAVFRPYVRIKHTAVRKMVKFKLTIGLCTMWGWTMQMWAFVPELTTKHFQNWEFAEVQDGILVDLIISVQRRQQLCKWLLWPCTSHQTVLT